MLVYVLKYSLVSYWIKHRFYWKWWPIQVNILITSMRHSYFCYFLYAGAGAVNAIGSDFILLTSLLTFDSETTINCSALTISEDIIKEANESLYFRITEDEPTIVSSNDTLNITIISKNGLCFGHTCDEY